MTTRAAGAGRRGRPAAKTCPAWSSTATSTSFPGRPEQFEPRIDGRPADRARRLRHEGRPRGDDVRAEGRRAPGAHARAADLRARRGVRGTRRAGQPMGSSSAAWAATSRSPASRPTCTSGRGKGVLVMRIEVHGRAAHSSTPWLGDNAVLKAIDVFRAIESLPFSRESSELFDRPSINLGRIDGGDALNKVPDQCTMAVDVRYLPGRIRRRSSTQVRAIPEIEVDPDVHIAAGVGRPYRPVRPGTARGGRTLDARRGDERRPRRRLRRRVVHRRGHPGGRVRARRRRPSRTRGMGLAGVAGALPAGAGRLRPCAADVARRRCVRLRGRAQGDRWRLREAARTRAAGAVAVPAGRGRDRDRVSLPRRPRWRGCCSSSTSSRIISDAADRTHGSCTLPHPGSPADVCS